jgi:DNA mismatch endonuclease (patch repair protein)
MQRQPTRDTAPELALRRLLHAAGLRYRVDAGPLPGLRRRADIVFRQARVAVFVDGCFWHGCPDHGRRPTTSNPRYWSEKVERNQTRDRDTDECLAAAGWAAMRVWEHEAPGEAAARIAATSVLAGSDWPTEHSRTLLATPRRRRKPVLELMS